MTKHLNWRPIHCNETQSVKFAQLLLIATQFRVPMIHHRVANKLVGVETREGDSREIRERGYVYIHR